MCWSWLAQTITGYIIDRLFFFLYVSEVKANVQLIAINFREFVIRKIVLFRIRDMSRPCSGISDFLFGSKGKINDGIVTEQMESVLMVLIKCLRK